MSIITKIGIIVILIAAIIAAFFVYGVVEYNKGVSTIKAQYANQVAKTNTASVKATTQVVTKYIDRVQVIKEKGDTIIKKVPVYVTKEDDTKCVINTGFVQLWNDANQMRVPDSTSTTNETASSVVLTDVAAQHAAEARLAHQTEEQLISLQNWVVQQQAAYGKNNGGK